MYITIIIVCNYLKKHEVLTKQFKNELFHIKAKTKLAISIL